MSPLYHELRNGLLAVCDEREAHAIALAVLEEVFGVARIDVYADKVRHFSDEERLHLQNILCRLQENTPLQYITGYAAFCGRRFEVSDAVLIPRPETEELVAAALESTPRRLLDVGTGSGCIAISLALALPRSSVEAWDLSADALEVARRNARRLGAEVRFEMCDVKAAPAAGRRFDLIVSNPPYICEKERADMERRVSDYEPHMALFVPDNDPLRFYRALACLGRNRLERGGRLVVEVNSAYGRETAALFKAEGYRDISLRKDLWGKDRIVSAFLE